MDKKDAVIKALREYWQAFENAERVDLVPVVRCKDCKNSEHWYRDKRRCFLWVEDGIDVFNDGFCNYGEKDGERHGVT